MRSRVREENGRLPRAYNVAAHRYRIVCAECVPRVRLDSPARFSQDVGHSAFSEFCRVMRVLVGNQVTELRIVLADRRFKLTDTRESRSVLVTASAALRGRLQSLRDSVDGPAFQVYPRSADAIQ